MFVESQLDFVALVVGLVAIYQHGLSGPDRQISNTRECEIHDTYDYIIVGAGSAGSVLASRLSEDPHRNVLLIEAGDQDPIFLQVPLLFGYAIKTSLDWQYVTTKQANLCGERGGICEWPRGRVLGGSSSINGMIYLRGNAKDYDAWEKAGNPGWAYEDVLPYFKKSEDMRIPEFINDTHHSTGGYLTVERGFVSPLWDYIRDLAAELNYTITDLNSPSQRGFDKTASTERNGSRCSSSRAFLVPARERCNLHVMLRTFVTRVNIDPFTRWVAGVDVIHNGRKRTLRTRRELILSAGAINTPQLLMLSGIGPKGELEKHGIPLYRDSSVGRNLQDHLLIKIGFSINETLSLGKDLFTDQVAKEFAINKTGPLTTTGIDAMAFMNTPLGDPEWPDVQMYFQPSIVPDPKSAHEIIHISACLLRPRSRGQIYLASSNPLDKPIIEPNYLEDEYDLNVTVEAVKMVLKMSETEALGRLNASFSSSYHALCPVPEVSLTEDREFLECLIRNYGNTVYHPVGTVKMGDRLDPQAIVDPELRLKGVRGLRVVDASVMPNIPSANTNAPTIMIAEKAADMIKDYNSRLLNDFIPYYGWPM